MKNNIVLKIILIILGSIISAYGITLAIHAGFGGATLAVLWQGLSYTFNISLGTASFLVAVIMIIVVFFYDKKQIYIGTILYQIVYSIMVDFFGNNVFYFSSRWLNLLIMLVGIVIFAVGTGIYASVDMGRGSYEAVTFAIHSHTGYPIKNIRMATDAAVVITGVLLGGKFGVCTVCTIILSGPVIQQSIKLMNIFMKKLDKKQ